jgi:hypothetical protein
MQQVHDVLGGTDTVLTLEAAQHVVAKLDAAKHAIAAAEAYIAVVDPVKCESYIEYKDAQVTMIAAVRAYRTAATACKRSSPIASGDTQGE